MFNGVWEGKETDKKLLILGESHYGNVEKTEEVINYYLKQPEKITFFTDIANVFGYDTKEEIKEFYNKIFFGNYVEELCEPKTNAAAMNIKSNSEDYNKHLFEFINEKTINYVVCFSKLSWQNLPKLEKGNVVEKTNIEGLSGSRKNWVEWCQYNQDANYEKCRNIKLNEAVKIYAINHPKSIGWFNKDKVREFIDKEKDLDFIKK